MRPALDHIPPDILCAQDYEAAAKEFIAPATYAYICGGSARAQTVSHNRAALNACTLMPRILQDVTAGDTRVSLAGEAFEHPILLAPVAHQKLVHPQGETETARGAAAMQSCMVVSTLSSCTLEQIAKTAPGEKWFQLYLQPTRQASLSLVKRAEAAGYTAIVLTVDAAIQLPDHAALRAGFQMPTHCVAANLVDQPAPEPVPVPPGESRIFRSAMGAAPLWADLDWLLSQTRLPIWVKGVLHEEDALKLKAKKVTGLIVSNHGGRGLDGAPSSLSVLPSLRAAVGQTYPLIFDGGIRSGADIFKALALGADAVQVGRLQLYALSVAGGLGVAHMIRTLREELEVTMALTGCTSVGDIRTSGACRSRNMSVPC